MSDEDAKSPFTGPGEGVDPDVVPEDLEEAMGPKRWQQHTAVALVFGFNELVKISTTLGEKVFFRLARDGANQAAMTLGVGVTMGEVPNVVLTLPAGKLWVKFGAADIELMRKAVADYDLAHPKQKSAGG